MTTIITILAVIAVVAILAVIMGRRRVPRVTPKEAPWWGLFELLRRELAELHAGKECHGCNTVAFIVEGLKLDGGCVPSDEDIQQSKEAREHLIAGLSKPFQGTVMQHSALEVLIEHIRKW